MRDEASMRDETTQLEKRLVTGIQRAAESALASRDSALTSCSETLYA
jgi:hypothetical protein